MFETRKLSGQSNASTFRKISKPIPRWTRNVGSCPTGHDAYSKLLQRYLSVQSYGIVRSLKWTPVGTLRKQNICINIQKVTSFLFHENKVYIFPEIYRKMNIRRLLSRTMFFRCFCQIIRNVWQIMRNIVKRSDALFEFLNFVLRAISSQLSRVANFRSFEGLSLKFVEKICHLEDWIFLPRKTGFQSTVRCTRRGV